MTINNNDFEDHDNFDTSLNGGLTFSITIFAFLTRIIEDTTKALSSKWIILSKLYHRGLDGVE